MKIIWLVSCLILVAHIQCSPRITEKYNSVNKVEGMKLLEPPHRIAGYFKLNRTYDAQMFYFFYESRNDPAKDPLVLWLTGGPGCSAEIAIFHENGPYYIEDNFTLSGRYYSWNKDHNMIYVDQPILTGFSYSDNPEDDVHGEKGVAQDLYEFLQEFLQTYPAYQNHEFFVTGESYGGHYVPAISNRIFQANLANEGPITINLKGFAIGDGYTDLAIQAGAYADYAYDNGLITKDQRDRVNRAVPSCTTAADMCKRGSDWREECIYAVSYCDSVTFNRVLYMVGNINYYDIRKNCTYPPLCYHWPLMSPYLNSEVIRLELGVGDRMWQKCTSSVGRDFIADFALDMALVIPPMVNAGIRANLYSGDQDFICNWLGNRRWVDAMKWNRSAEWSTVQDLEWSVDGEAAGTVASVGPLQFVKVYQAGHMVPMDQPKNAYDMIYKWIRNIPLATPPESVDELGILQE